MGMLEKLLNAIGVVDEEEYYEDELEEIKPASKETKDGKTDKPSVLTRASGLFKNKKVDDKVEEVVAPAAAQEEPVAPKEEKKSLFSRKETVRPAAPSAPRKTAVDLKTDRQTTGKFGTKNMTIPIENKMVNVVVIEPIDFNEDCPKIGNYLRGNQPVIVNFTNTDRVMAARMTDFISGTIYALNGNMKKISREILVCAPKNVDIDSDNDLIPNRGEGTWKH